MILQLIDVNLNPVLTKLGYLIDNPWNNALDRAKRSESFVFPFAYRVLRLENAASKGGEEGKTIST